MKMSGSSVDMLGWGWDGDGEPHVWMGGHVVLEFLEICRAADIAEELGEVPRAIRGAEEVPPDGGAACADLGRAGGDVRLNEDGKVDGHGLRDRRCEGGLDGAAVDPRRCRDGGGNRSWQSPGS